jgi:hypothetical protein
MSYQFQPLTDEEIDLFQLIPEGTYNFEIIKSTRKISKQNNPIAELQLKVWDTQGKTHTIYDYLVFSSIPLNIKKIRNFCNSTGLQEQYKQGNLPEELEGIYGKAYIGIREEQKDQSTGKTYPKKNIVLDYVYEEKTAKQEQPKPESNFDDEVPF